MTESSKFETLTIYDILGKAVLTFKKPELNTGAFDVSGLNKGAYILATDDGANLKFIKK